MQPVFHCEPLLAHTANVGLGRVGCVVDQDVLLHGVLFYLLSTIVTGEYGVLVRNVCLKELHVGEADVTLGARV